jgi:hypothetical protein
MTKDPKYVRPGKTLEVDPGDTVHLMVPVPKVEKRPHSHGLESGEKMVVSGCENEYYNGEQEPFEADIEVYCDDKGNVQMRNLKNRRDLIVSDVEVNIVESQDIELWDMSNITEGELTYMGEEPIKVDVIIDYKMVQVDAEPGDTREDLIRKAKEVLE